jgi:glycosyltransferase involved in cell wall biosynthesis
MGGVGYYRLIWPAQAVRKLTGWDVSIHDKKHPLTDATGYDVVVVQRMSEPKQIKELIKARAMGIGLVHDVDDALWRVDRRNRAWSYHNEVVGGMRRYQLVDVACDIADVVTASTDMLARRYGGDHGVVLRNALPGIGRVQEAPGPREVVRIGWTGSLATHPGDLEVMGDAVARVLAADPDVQFAVIGEPAYRIAPVLGIPESRIEALDWVPIRHYHQELRERIDVMLVPLADTAFNRSKSWLKALEASGGGLAVTASGTEENMRLSQHTSISIVPHGGTELDWATAIRWAVEKVRIEPWLVRTPDACQPLSLEARAAEWAATWEAARRG